MKDYILGETIKVTRDYTEEIDKERRILMKFIENLELEVKNLKYAVGD